MVVRAFVDALEEEGGHIAFAAVREHGEDDRAFFRLLRKLQRGVEGRAAGDAGQDASCAARASAVSRDSSSPTGMR